MISTTTIPLEIMVQVKTLQRTKKLTKSITSQFTMKNSDQVTQGVQEPHLISLSASQEQASLQCLTHFLSYECCYSLIFIVWNIRRCTWNTLYRTFKSVHNEAASDLQRKVWIKVRDIFRFGSCDFWKLGQAHYRLLLDLIVTRVWSSISPLYWQIIRSSGLLIQRRLLLEEANVYWLCNYFPGTHMLGKDFQTRCVYKWLCQYDNYLCM